MSLEDLPSYCRNRHKYGFLFGKKLAASMSPFFHNVIYEHLHLNWEQIRLESADIEVFLKLIDDPGFYGS